MNVFFRDIDAALASITPSDRADMYQRFGVKNPSALMDLTPLMLAASLGHKDACTALVMRNAQVYLKNRAGKTALDLATDDEVRFYITDSVAMRPIHYGSIDVSEVLGDSDAETHIYSVTGTATNVSGRMLRYVEIDLNFFDATGNLVESGVSNVQNLEDQASWHFKVSCLRPEAVSYKIEGVKGVVH